MVDLCIKNNQILLKEYLVKKIKRKEFIPKTLLGLKNDLNMEVIPKRIEAFDNSNIQGKSAVAGMVCFIDGKPSKKRYRHYNIKTVLGIDDFESMREVVFRRYSRQIKENNPLPDLILIDGGKGQLSAAKSSLDKLGLGYISIIGLGYVGLPLLLALGKEGFSVTGIDIDNEKVGKLKQNTSYISDISNKELLDAINTIQNVDFTKGNVEIPYNFNSENHKCHGHIVGWD